MLRRIIKYLLTIFFLTLTLAQGDYLTIADKMPEVKGGMGSIYKKINYPRTAKEAGIEGKVFLLVFVNENGKVDKVQTVKGLGGGCDEAAEEAVKTADFIPGQSKGQNVKVKMALVVQFKLDK